MRRQPMRNFLLTCALAVPVFAGTSTPGIENFHQVDAHVFRGAQPSEEGFRYLANLGVKTVIDLRESDVRSRKEEQQVTAAGMKYVNVPMTGLTPPTQVEVTTILGILENDSQGAVFVHCKRGADRTGAVIASYRIEHDGWDNSRALSEAKSDGMSFFQLPRQDYILTFQARKLEAKAAAPASSSSAVLQAVAQ
jgi:tyrosine-protein phosphatase SIW14